MMKFDADGRTIEKDDKQARLLLLGLFISRSLVTTVSLSAHAVLMTSHEFHTRQSTIDKTHNSVVSFVYAIHYQMSLTMS